MNSLTPQSNIKSKNEMNNSKSPHLNKYTVVNMNSE